MRVQKRNGGLIVAIIASTLIVLVGVGAFAFSITYKRYTVSGPSMQPTLTAGQQILATRKGGQPVRGDIIIFNDRYTGHVGLSRVIGLAGDRVVVQNGNVLVYDAGHPDGFNPDRAYGIAGNTTDGSIDVKVPAGSVFVLGDNRDDALDSRVIGAVSVKDILGIERRTL